MSKIKTPVDGEQTAALQQLTLLQQQNEILIRELKQVREELAFQKEEKGKRAAELGIANVELLFQGGEKEKRAAELGIANIELAFQDEEKGKRAAELGIANKELAFQDEEKEKRAQELGIANIELAYQVEEKEKRAAELIVANKELVYQNEEKEKRAAELSIANQELIFQNNEKEKRAAELIIANKELLFQNEEKEKRAAELIIANDELAFQNEEKEKRAAELIVANYARSLIEASLDPLVTINAAGKITDVNEASIKVTGASRKELIDTDFSSYFTDPEKAAEGYRQVFEKGFVADYALTIKHKNGTLTDVLYNASVYKDNKGNVLGVFAAARDVTEQKWAIDLRIANKELAFQNDEKEKRAAELIIANKELVFQNDEKEKRAAELIIANEELVFQNKEKEKRAAELIIANKELAFQNQEKEKRAEEKERRAAELVIANKELLFQNDEKEKRAAELEEKNKEVEAARSDIEKKTKLLEVSSKYKSEFLANMSHELRTPLNSLLILSKDLSENKSKNLTPDQVECSEIIYKSGHDLLVLINEVLDLSKIEAGKMTLNVERVILKSFTEDLLRGFKHNAEIKGLSLHAHLDASLPEYIISDSQRLKQILKNLVSNAIKFTDKGSVTLDFKKNSDSTIIISVTDTGIGILESKQLAVFEAFQQADGTTSRKYGGTGLGLSISRELAKLLGAEITLSSKLNEGSTFCVTVPIEMAGGDTNVTENIQVYAENRTPINPSAIPDFRFLNYPTIKDDRETMVPGDKTVLIVEDDLKFAEILLKLANQKGFKCLAASTGEDGFELALKHQPKAIILDIGLPGIKGRDLLDKLKRHPALSHIPVHIISGDGNSQDYLDSGAIEYLMKPIQKQDMEGAFDRIEKFINRKIKNLLIVEDDENSRKALKVLIGQENVNYFEAMNGDQAISICNENEIDCIILDMELPDMSGLDFIYNLEKAVVDKLPKIIVYTGKDLSTDMLGKLRKYTKSIFLKGVESQMTILKETELFLHRSTEPVPLSELTPVNIPHDHTTFLQGKKILLVDDDYRNVFALTKILTERGMTIIKAENGVIALEKLDGEQGIDLVLMDIMMPVMDGYEATRILRTRKKFQHLPVIAVTAKAMSYDQQKCLAAGANNYITKPVEIEKLLSMMAELIRKSAI